MRKKGSQFLRFIIPLIEVLKANGGSATSNEATDLVIEKTNISEDEQQEVLKNGTSRIRNQVAWARSYLVKTDYLNSSTRGVWSLTEKGLNTDIEKIIPLSIYKEVQGKYIKKTSSTNLEEINNNKLELIEEAEQQDQNYRVELLNLLKNLSPSGFERLTQRLLREAGFQNVVVTGKTGDGGIDGHGILQINPLVSFKVMFQCKRFQNSVSPSQIRDFRGAIIGRAEKGIFITTGTYTINAKEEARRDGVVPIELVDGEQLVKMFEQLELGLQVTKTFEINHEFFRQYKSVE
ncbi:restriction endonuclease [Rippkaea orientalis PCC 8801]|uniref:Restriction endonuclease n=1 Tax=Rippkaea orientalis (strain PCC 8801 / RF-1) TaxID=41431 RepID=B7K2U8_RIPO1|nr:restriction endonuclease [Rippkaea orientalis]ACK67649.1 restriction endonuclease [Rippkaea orientalis PCC 8801]